MKVNNPYSELLGVMRRQGGKSNPPSIQIGIILSVSPLVIKINNLQIDKDNILIADTLLKKSTGEIDPAAGLSPQDKVALIATSDKKTYIVLCRVVAIDE